MAAPTLPYKLSEKSHEAVIAFYKQCYGYINASWNMRSRLEDIDRAYQRETDNTSEHNRAKFANARGDSTRFQNITIPVVMPQVENAVTYQQSVFLSGYPIFGVVSTPEFAEEALQMDTIIGEQQVRGKWVANLLQAIRNGFKYNFGPVEVDWSREVSYAIESDATFSNGSQGRPRQVIWEGNKIKCLDPYNTFFDTRVRAEELPTKGEFAGYNEIYSRVALKQYVDSLPVRWNLDKAYSTGFAAPIADGATGAESFYVPQINNDALVDRIALTQGTNWLAWAGIAGREHKYDYKDSYQVTTLYARILPADFGISVPGQTTAQVWKFIIVNNQTIVYSERMTNAHSLLPIIICQPSAAGLGWQDKSFADNVKPFQDITSALSNSTIAARRRAISDRFIYDQSRISEAHINNPSPTARIPVRPVAFGTDIRTAVHPLPFNDDQFQFNSAEIQMYLGLVNQVSGLNPARQGQFVKGNKTRFEFAEVMGYANGRDQTVALTLEDHFFGPIKDIIKANILQFQGRTALYNPEQETTVEVNPVALRRAILKFKVSDGINPSEKLVDGESLAMAFQTLASVPALSQAYNLGPMFSYLMKSRGARIGAFEKSQAQQAYEQAVGVWQQTCMQIAESLIKGGATPEDIQKALPPQPTPDQFGYDPENPQVEMKSFDSDGKGGPGPSLLGAIQAKGDPQPTPGNPQAAMPNSTGE